MGKQNYDSISKGTHNRRPDNKSRGKSKGKPYNGNGGKKYSNKMPDKANATSTVAAALNDMSWYKENPVLLEAAGRWPFPKRPGMQIGTQVQSLEGSRTLQTWVPGVMGIGYVSTVGYSDGPTSPASIAAREMYARIRSAFSGSLDEDPPDLIMYLFALCQIHSYIAFVKRVYGLLNLYTGDNFDFPDRVLGMFNVTNPDTLRNNKTQIWGRLNTNIYNANKFSIPARFHLFSRQRWMNENVYMDEPSRMAQSYVFYPTSYFQIDDTGSNGTELKIHSVPAITNVASLFKPLEDMINAISAWGDAYTIDGHIKRAFEGEPMIGSDLVEEGYTVVPVYSPEVLLQIENLHCVTGSGSITIPDITQDPVTNSVLWGATVTLSTGTSANAVMTDTILNIHSDAPTAEDVVIASRLANYLIPDTSTTAKVICGTELVTNIDIDYGSMQMHNLLLDIGTEYGGGGVPLMDRLLLREVVLLSWFTHAPIMHILTSMTTADSTRGELLLRGDMHNANAFDTELLEDLHRVCIYSEFNCFK